LFTKFLFRVYLDSAEPSADYKEQIYSLRDGCSKLFLGIRECDTDYRKSELKRI